MNEIGKNLKRIRLLKNLSLKDAGNLLNMTATAISKYEKGEILPDSKKLIDFANAYNVKSIDLLKVYNVPKMQFTSFRKKKRLTGQNLELLKELIENKVSKYLEVIEMNNIDTVNMKGEGFECLVEMGQKVKAGQPIITFDADKIKQAGYSTTSMLVVTGEGSAKNINFNSGFEAKAGEDIVVTFE